jgi:hypothetical protein
MKSENKSSNTRPPPKIFREQRGFVTKSSTAPGLCVLRVDQRDICTLSYRHLESDAAENSTVCFYDELSDLFV